jgi:hypothetical protein
MAPGGLRSQGSRRQTILSGGFLLVDHQPQRDGCAILVNDMRIIHSEACCYGRFWSSALLRACGAGACPS